MQKIVPFLWFDGKAEEAANFYVSIFKNSKVLSVTRYGEAGPGPKGSVMSVTFQLEGQQFYALNGGPISPQDGPERKSRRSVQAGVGWGLTSGGALYI